MNFKNLKNLALIASIGSSAYATDRSYQNSETAAVKQSKLWQYVGETLYEGSYPSNDAGFFDSLNLFKTCFLKTSFTHNEDFMPKGRMKLIHTYGSTAKAELNIHPNSPYSGIFQQGGIGIVRLSLGKQSGSYLPGLALKILVDHKPSVNFHAIYSLDGQEEYKNFFRNSFSTHISAPNSLALRILLSKFETSVEELSDDPSQRPESANILPQYAAASQNPDGTLVKNIKTPFSVSFVPNPKLTASYEEVGDFRNQFAKILPGTVIYTVWVKANEHAEPEMIGDLKVTSEFHASEFGDKELYFQHQSQRHAPKASKLKVEL